MRPHIHIRRDSIAASLTAREMRAGYDYGDARERGAILADIETYAMSLSVEERHDMASLPQGSLNDGSLPTQRLRQAIAVLAALPGISMPRQYGGRVGR